MFCATSRHLTPSLVRVFPSFTGKTNRQGGMDEVYPSFCFDGIIWPPTWIQATEKSRSKIVYIKASFWKKHFPHGWCFWLSSSPNRVDSISFISKPKKELMSMWNTGGQNSASPLILNETPNSFIIVALFVTSSHMSLSSNHLNTSNGRYLRSSGKVTNRHCSTGNNYLEMYASFSFRCLETSGHQWPSAFLCSDRNPTLCGHFLLL